MDRTTLRRLSEGLVQTVGATEARSRPKSLFSGCTNSNRSCRASCRDSRCHTPLPRPPRRVLALADQQQAANELASQARRPSGLSWEPALVSSLSSFPCDA